MKKLLAMLLVLVMALSLAACAGSNNETVPATEAPTEAPTEEPTLAGIETPDAPIEEVPQPAVMSYAEYAAAPLESEVTVETTIQAYEAWWDGSVDLYCQSADGAYYIYGLACTEEEAAALVPGTVISVTGWKTAWDGEVEIAEAKYEIIEGEAFTATAVDYTSLLGTDELIAHMNELAAFKGLTVTASTDASGNEAAYLYKWDGSGTQGDDLYFNVELNGTVYTFTVNAYMNGTGSDSEVYKAIEGLSIGDKIDVEGFLYWYNGAQPHITSVTVAA